MGRTSELSPKCPVVSHKELETIIGKCVDVGESLMIHGPPGIGKSQVTEQVAKNMAKMNKLEYSNDIKDWQGKEDKYVLTDLRAAEMPPEEVCGILFPNRETHATERFLPFWFPRTGKGLLFLDEINLGSDMVLKTCYELIHDRRLSGFPLPKGWGIVSAGNRAEDNCSVTEMPEALTLRYAHVELRPPTHEEWTDWAATHNIDPKVISYIATHPEDLFKFDPVKDDSYGKPTPRGWEKVSNLTDGTEGDLMQNLVGAIIGAGTAVKFAAHIREFNKLRPIEEYLKNPKKIVLPDEIKEIDLVWSLIVSLATVVGREEKSTNDDAAGILMARFSDEYAIFGMRLLLNQIKEKNMKRAVNLAHNAFDTIDKKRVEIWSKYLDIKE